MNRIKPNPVPPAVWELLRRLGRAYQEWQGKRSGKLRVAGKGLANADEAGRIADGFGFEVAEVSGCGGSRHVHAACEPPRKRKARSRSVTRSAATLRPASPKFMEKTEGRAQDQKPASVSCCHWRAPASSNPSLRPWYELL